MCGTCNPKRTENSWTKTARLKTSSFFLNLSDVGEMSPSSSPPLSSKPQIHLAGNNLSIPTETFQHRSALQETSLRSEAEIRSCLAQKHRKLWSQCQGFAAGVNPAGAKLQPHSSVDKTRHLAKEHAKPCGKPWARRTMT